MPDNLPETLPVLAGSELLSLVEEEPTGVKEAIRTGYNFAREKFSPPYSQALSQLKAEKKAREEAEAQVKQLTELLPNQATLEVLYGALDIYQRHVYGKARCDGPVYQVLEAIRAYQQGQHGEK